jgi:hypothetical protein
MEEMEFWIVVILNLHQELYIRGFSEVLGMNIVRNRITYQK